MRLIPILLIVLLTGCQTAQNYPEKPRELSINEIILQGSDGLEIPANREIEYYYWHFLNSDPQTIRAWVENSRGIIPHIRDEITKAGLPEDIIYLPFLESGYNPVAYSWVGAGGIWQFMPKTGRYYGLNINWWTDERRSFQLATPQAINHLKHLYNRFGDWYLALAAYNAGEGRINSLINETGHRDYFALSRSGVLPKETKNYIPQLIAIIKIMKNLEILGFDPIQWNNRLEYRSTVVEGGTDLYKLVRDTGLDWEVFNMYNPSFLRKVSDPSRDLTIFIPKEDYYRVKSYLGREKPLTYRGWEYYSVKKGDNWAKLARVTKTSSGALKRLNDRESNSLRVGERILIPTPLIKLKEAPADIKTKEPETLLASADFKGKYLYHTVVTGDTLSGISIKYNIKLHTIYYLNGLNPYSIIKAGQTIKLPMVNRKTHRVAKGETLWRISRNYNLSVDRIMKINNISDPRNLKIGDELILY